MRRRYLVMFFFFVFLSLFGQEKSVIFKENFDLKDKNWLLIDEIDENVGYTSPPSCKMFSSNRYAITKSCFEIKPDTVYEIGGWVKTAGDVTSASKIYVEILNEKGNRLKIFGSEGTKSTEWVYLFVRISPDNLPSGSKCFKIWLQSAEGINQKGTAWFDDIVVKEYKEEEKMNYKRDIIKEEGETIDIKVSSVKDSFYSGIKAIDESEETGWISKPGETNYFIISWLNFQKINEIEIIQNPEYLSDFFEIYSWSDERQDWQKIIEKRQITGNVIKIDSLNIETRKLKIKFYNEKSKSSSINMIYLYSDYIPEEEEYWQAYWICYPESRSESEFQTRYFIKIFDIEEEIESAYLQWNCDDEGKVYINNNFICNHSGSFSVKNYFKKGRNIIAAEVHNMRYSYGLILECYINFTSGNTLIIKTDDTWLVSRNQEKDWKDSTFIPSSLWVKPLIIAKPPKGVWGRIPFNRDLLQKVKYEIIDKKIPLEAKAGELLKVEIKIRFISDFNHNVYPKIIIEKNGICLYSIKGKSSKELKNIKGGEEITIEGFVNLSKFLPEGKYDLKLDIPFAKSQFEKNIISSIFVKNEKRINTTEVKIEKIGNVPTIVVNGVPTYMMIFHPGSGSSELDWYRKLQIMAFNYQNINFYKLRVGDSLLWPSKDNINFAVIDKGILSILDANPEGYVILDLIINKISLPWWKNEHPEELIVFDDGRKGNFVSLCSKKWRKDIGEVIKVIIQYIEKSPYGDRIVGYVIGDGAEGQWLNWWAGTPEQPGSQGDYSKPAVEGFREWLKKQYKTEEKLREAWKDDKVTFETACIPTKEERLRMDKGLFKDPSVSRKVPDYLLYLSDMIAEDILYYGKIVKEATNWKKLFGVLYGHLLDIGCYFLGQDGGNLSIEKVINSEYLDFLAGPIGYYRGYRDIGGVGSFGFPPSGSLLLRNKIWIHEEDIRTHLATCSYKYSISNVEDSIETLKREFVNSYCSGSGLYWYDLSNFGERGWFDDEEIMEILGKMNKVAEKYLIYNRKPVREIAVIIDTKTFAYMKPSSGQSKENILSTLLTEQLEQISRIGAPIELHLSTDFQREDMPEYKFYIFLVDFYLDELTRKSILKKLKNSGSIVLWLYASGVLNDKEFSTENMKHLIGMDFEFTEVKKPLSINLVPGKFKSSIKTFGVEKNPFLIFYPKNFKGEVYGTLSINGEPGLCSIKMNGWTSIFCSIPIIPAEILREIAEKAGVHIYLRSNEPVYVCESIIGVHTTFPGNKIIYLPLKKEVYDLETGEKLGDAIDKIEFYSKGKETKLFLIK